MEKSQYYVVFRNVRHLLLALHFCLGDSTVLFPSQVIEIKKGSWAVSLALLGLTKNQFEHLCKQHGWQADVIERLPRGTRVVSLTSLLGGEWSYHDPQRLDQENISHNWDELPVTGYDPADTGTRYILGARDQRQAEHGLRALTNALAQGIKARPVLLESENVKAPFTFFWVVTTGRPSLAVLQAAERAWWGPVGYGRVQIFEEWPYTSQIPDVCLHRFDWGQDGRIVLLSKNEPEILVVRMPDGAPTFDDLIDVADLKVHEQRPLVVRSVHAKRTDFTFTVDLRLVEQDQQRLNASRINELTCEIEAKQAILEQMKELYEASDEDLDVAPEPLFLYASSASSIPFQLRRLLIEWADQPEELKALRYQKLDSKSLPDVLTSTPANTDIHVLTTACALGLEAMGSVGLRLREYRPSIGRLVSFDLLSEWTPFGLRLFVPHGQRLALYPALRPSPLAAQKLARALCPDENFDIRHGAMLLVPLQEGHLCGCRLPLPFQPLVDAFEWQCTLEIPIRTLRTIEPVAQQTAKRLLAVFEHAFSSTIAAQARGRVQSQHDRLKADVERLGNEVQQRSKRAEQFETEIQSVEKLLSKAAAVLDSLQKPREDLFKNLSAIDQEMNHALSDLSRRHRIVQTSHNVEEQAAALRKSIEEIIKEIRQFINSTESH